MTKDRVFPTFATLRGRTSTVELLLMKGASIEAMNKARKTPMQYEIVILPSTAELLLTKGAAIEAMDIRGRLRGICMVKLLSASIKAINIYNNTLLKLMVILTRATPC